MNAKTLGVLGGMGPMATAYFFKTVVDLTPASCDSEHIPMLIINDTAIPDRTDYILDPSKPNPYPRLEQDVKKLTAWGAERIAIPCNTSHVFYDKLQEQTEVPIINIVRESVLSAFDAGRNKKIGLMATSGTISSAVYSDACERVGAQCIIPPENINILVMDMIYRQVKMGQKCPPETFFDVISSVLSLGCDAVILGCTELSVIYKDAGARDGRVFDSTEILARACVEECTGFSAR